MKTKEPYVITIKCLVDGKINAETERRNIFACCNEELNLAVIFSDVEPANRLDLEVAKDMELISCLSPK